MDSVRIQDKFNTNIAKNIILFVGDGMSIATMTAARIYKTQQVTKNDRFDKAERSFLTMEKFENSGYMKVYLSN